MSQCPYSWLGHVYAPVYRCLDVGVSLFMRARGVYVCLTVFLSRFLYVSLYLDVCGYVSQSRCLCLLLRFNVFVRPFSVAFFSLSLFSVCLFYLRLVCLCLVSLYFVSFRLFGGPFLCLSFVCLIYMYLFRALSTSAYPCTFVACDWHKTRLTAVPFPIPC